MTQYQQEASKLSEALGPFINLLSVQTVKGEVNRVQGPWPWSTQRHSSQQKTNTFIIMDDEGTS